MIRLIDQKVVYWGHGFVYSFSAGIVWIILIPVIFLLSLKIFFNKGSWIKKCFKHLLAIIIIAPTHAILFLSINYYIQSSFKLWIPGEEKNYAEYFPRAFPNLSADSALFYVIIVGLLTGYIIYLKNIRDSQHKALMEADLTESKLKNLQYQLQPHFLFNSLQTISNLMYLDTKVADEAIASLSDILRFSINNLNKNLISLQEEVDITRKYLDFQKLRFKDKVTYDIIFDGSLQNISVPSLILQPIVENSIKHSLESEDTSVSINIKVYKSESGIIFEILDTGPGFDSNFHQKKDEGGMKNLEKRLNYFYQNDYKLEVKNLSKGGAVVSIEIPK